MWYKSHPSPCSQQQHSLCASLLNPEMWDRRALCLGLQTAIMESLLGFMGALAISLQRGILASPQTPCDSHMKAWACSPNRGCPGAVTGRDWGFWLIRATEVRWCLKQAGGHPAPVPHAGGNWPSAPFSRAKGYGKQPVPPSMPRAAPQRMTQSYCLSCCESGQAT